MTNIFKKSIAHICNLLISMVIIGNRFLYYKNRVILYRFLWMSFENTHFSTSNSKKIDLEMSLPYFEFEKFIQKNIIIQEIMKCLRRNLESKMLHTYRKAVTSKQKIGECGQIHFLFLTFHCNYWCHFIYFWNSIQCTTLSFLILDHFTLFLFYVIETQPSNYDHQITILQNLS